MNTLENKMILAALNWDSQEELPMIYLLGETIAP